MRRAQDAEPYHADDSYRGFNQRSSAEQKYHLYFQPKWSPNFGDERQLTYAESTMILNNIEHYVTMCRVFRQPHFMYTLVIFCWLKDSYVDNHRSKTFSTGVGRK